ncbi:hypothetical protein BDK51DRAFT_50988 [Blyttiomyces helicus]|uniref:Uncharacterized protein n=1 Tax=Blyttiomyces helicus TaxID=388810 RepID=A0A4V1IRY4_9FUNG|nr:hypothetical protein BDK51DRAFT_50988 [Blyttiomyces helicus]|eukprot:RKO91667.1 hypothetical protein BDK51DRAFT_50988 [Blyttiomyces helicus]
MPAPSAAPTLRPHIHMLKTTPLAVREEGPARGTGPAAYASAPGAGESATCRTPLIPARSHARAIGFTPHPDTLLAVRTGTDVFGADDARATILGRCWIVKFKQGCSSREKKHREVETFKTPHRFLTVRELTSPIPDHSPACAPTIEPSPPVAKDPLRLIAVRGKGSARLGLEKSTRPASVRRHRGTIPPVKPPHKSREAPAGVDDFCPFSKVES